MTLLYPDTISLPVALKDMPYRRDLDIKELERRCGLTLAASVHEELCDILDYAAVFLEAERTSVRSSKLTIYLDRAAGHTKKALGLLPETTQWETVRDKANCRIKKELSSKHRPDLDSWIVLNAPDHPDYKRAAARAARKVKRKAKRGREPLNVENDVVSKLANLFVKNGGTATFYWKNVEVCTTPFSEWYSYIVSHVEGLPVSDDQLFAVLKRRRKRIALKHNMTLPL